MTGNGPTLKGHKMSFTTPIAILVGQPPRMDWLVLPAGMRAVNALENGANRCEGVSRRFFSTGRAAGRKNKRDALSRVFAPS